MLIGSGREGFMRNILRTGAVLALGMLGGLAAASDYIVARSTDASIVKGTALAAGAVVPAAVGAVVTLISAGGEVVILKGTESGIKVPGAAKAASSVAASKSSRLWRRFWRCRTSRAAVASRRRHSRRTSIRLKRPLRRLER